MSTSARLARLGMLHLENLHRVLMRALNDKSFREKTRHLSKDELDALEVTLAFEEAEGTKGECGWSNLHDAVVLGSVEQIERASAEGLDLQAHQPCAGASPGDTLLHLTALEGNLEVARWLLANGFDPNVRGEYYCTPLHLAAYANKSEVAQLLIDSGADIEPECKWYGRTPLGQAARKGSVEVAAVLLKAGADPCDRDAIEQARSTMRDAKDLAEWDDLGEMRDTASGSKRILSLMKRWRKRRGRVLL